MTEPTVDVPLDCEWPLERAENETWFHQHPGNNYINPPGPQFNGGLGDCLLSNPGAAA